MNKRRIIGLLFLLLLTGIGSSLQAQTRLWTDRVADRPKTHNQTTKKGLRTTQYDGVHHLLGVYVDGSYSMFLNNVPVYHTNPGGYGAGLGFLYNYQHGPLLLQVGVGARWQDVKDSINNKAWTRSDVDSKNYPFTLGYSFYSRYDVTRNVYLQVPIMVGSYFWHCYILGGVKLNAQVWGDTYMSARGTTTGDYSQFIGPFEQMDNHGFREDVPFEWSGEKVNFGVDVMATLELGYEMPINDRGKTSYRKSKKEKDMRVRIAAFAELGIRNICPGEEASLYTIPEATRYDFPTYQMTHAFSTTEANTKSVHNFFVGVRFSYFFFGYQSKEKCLLCGSRGYQTPWR